MSWASNAGRLGGLAPEAFRRTDAPVPWSAISAAIAGNLTTWLPGDGFVLDGNTFSLSPQGVRDALLGSSATASLGGDLFVFGAGDVVGDLDVGGAIHATGGVSTDGVLSGASVSTTGAASFDGTVDALGAATFYDDASVGGNLVVEGDATLYGDLAVGGGVGLGPQTAGCGSASAPTGTLRYQNGRFEGCTSAGWVALTTLKPGTSGAPASSCAQIKQDYPSSASGVYYLTVPGQGSFQAYCDMTTDGGPSWA